MVEEKLLWKIASVINEIEDIQIIFVDNNL